MVVKVLTPAHAYWKQRHELLSIQDRLEKLFEIVDSANELCLYQWAQLYCFAREFRPDLILELGREKGNSTCVFTEAANSLHGLSDCRVVSLCWSDKFANATVPRLVNAQLVDDNWFRRLDCHQVNILDVDYEDLLSDYRKIMVFWDAHGFDVAGCVLGRILPVIQHKTHYVLMHDLSDQRYMSKDQLSYGNQGIWTGNSHGNARFILGNVNSAVAQAISIADFCRRNALTLESADHTFHRELAVDHKAATMRRLLGDDLFSLQGHWFYFSLNEHEGPFTFPEATPSASG